MASLVRALCVDPDAGTRRRFSYMNTWITATQNNGCFTDDLQSILVVFPLVFALFLFLFFVEIRGTGHLEAGAKALSPVLAWAEMQAPALEANGKPDAV